jgi:hypothetical protein
MSVLRRINGGKFTIDTANNSLVRNARVRPLASRRYTPPDDAVSDSDNEGNHDKDNPDCSATDQTAFALASVAMRPLFWLRLAVGLIVAAAFAGQFAPESTQLLEGILGRHATAMVA